MSGVSGGGSLERRQASWWTACLIFAVVVVLVGAHQARAGQGTAGSIIGLVADDSGAVLPGVTVTVTGPSLQVPSVTGISDEKGEYRIAPLPIGTYTVAYELQGFQPVRREGILLTVGFIAKVDITMGVGTVAETVTVSGQAPLVDVTSTSTSTQFTREQLEIIPTSRNSILSLMAQAPGVRSSLEVGGNVSFQPPGTRVFGQGAEAWYVLEGVFTTSLQTDGGVGQYWDYNAIEEASVQTIGSSAEVGSRGVAVNAVVKSGGNNFSGNGFAGYMSDALQSDNIDDKLAAQGIKAGGKLVKRYDVSADLGGRIIRDKLWFYGATRKRLNISEVLGAVKTDGSQATNDQGQRFYTTKVSYQLNAGNKLVGFYQYSLRKPSAAGSANADWTSRTTNYLYQRTRKIEWQSVRSNALVLDVQWGHWAYWDNPRFCAGAEELGHPCAGSALDQFTGYSTGAPTNEGQTLRYWRHDVKGTMSWYKSNFLGGNHELKAGIDVMPNRGYRGNISRESGANYQLVFNNRAPVQIAFWNYPTQPDQHVDYTGVYGQDSWTIGRRLTLNLGVRYGHDNAFVPAACREAADAPSNIVFPAACYDRVQFKVQNTIGPRLRAAFDVFGNGRTVIKGGWGRYNQIHMIDPDIQGADPRQGATATFRWTDPNGNRLYDPGEVNFDLNGPAFISITGGSNQVPNPNEKLPKTDEFSATLERQLGGTMAVRASTVYSRASDIYRLNNLLRPYEVWNTVITRPDPGNDGVVGNADDTGQNITFYSYPAALAGAKFQLFSLLNDSKATQTYKSLELAISRRMANRWQLQASYTTTKSNNPIIDGLAPAETALTNRAGAADPNSEIFSANRTWDWMIRTSGAYIFPFDITTSANFEHRSGTPWARQVLFSGVPVLSTITLRVEPIGTRRLPNINTLDLRAEKSFRMQKNQRLIARANIYNALNANTVTSLTQRSGPIFGVPLAILPPRNIEFSASFSF